MSEENKKYLDYEGLAHYDERIKEYINTAINLLDKPFVIEWQPLGNSKEGGNANG